MFPFYIFVGPSGVGKDTLVDRLCSEFGVRFLVGYTSRKPREGEVDGEKMHFRTEAEMRAMYGMNQFIVPTVYCGNYYGTRFADIEEAMETGPAHVCILDVEGTLEFVKRYPMCTVFYIKPPEEAVLSARLKTRNPSITPEVLAAREEKSRTEMELMEKSAACIPRMITIVNDDLEKAYKKVCSVVTS